MPVETTANFHRFRITSPGQYKKFAVRKMAPGVEAVMGVDGEGKTHVQSMLFDKEKFTASDSKKWLTDHDMKMIGESDLGLSVASGWVLEQRLDLAEMMSPRMSTSTMQDEELLDVRGRMCEARRKLQDEHAAMAMGEQYSTGAGRQCMADIDYYSRVISGIEYEMGSRGMMLDGVEDDGEKASEKN